MDNEWTNPCPPGETQPEKNSLASYYRRSLLNPLKQNRAIPNSPPPILEWNSPKERIRGGPYLEQPEKSPDFPRLRRSAYFALAPALCRAHSVWSNLEAGRYQIGLICPGEKMRIMNGPSFTG
jgi:hypothetical protein